jgi:hypothetical protein
VEPYSPVSQLSPNSVQSRKTTEPPVLPAIYNPRGAIRPGDLRCFKVNTFSVCPVYNFDQLYEVAYELQEMTDQYILPFRVSIYWEEMYGHSAPPSGKLLCFMAREEMKKYLASNRAIPCFSTHNKVVHLRIPEEAPKLATK